MPEKETLEEAESIEEVLGYILQEIAADISKFMDAEGRFSIYLDQIKRIEDIYEEDEAISGFAGLMCASLEDQGVEREKIADALEAALDHEEETQELGNRDDERCHRCGEFHEEVEE